MAMQEDLDLFIGSEPFVVGQVVAIFYQNPTVHQNTIFHPNFYPLYSFFNPSIIFTFSYPKSLFIFDVSNSKSTPLFSVSI